MEQELVCFLDAITSRTGRKTNSRTHTHTSKNPMIYPRACHNLLKSLFICYNIASVLCFGFLPARHVGILAPQPGIEPAPAALEGKVLTSGPTGKSLQSTLKHLGSEPLVKNCWVDNLMNNSKHWLTWRREKKNWDSQTRVPMCKTNLDYAKEHDIFAF